MLGREGANTDRLSTHTRTHAAQPTSKSESPGPKYMPQVGRTSPEFTFGGGPYVARVVVVAVTVALSQRRDIPAFMRTGWSLSLRLGVRCVALARHPPRGRVHALPSASLEAVWAAAVVALAVATLGLHPSAQA